MPPALDFLLLAVVSLFAIINPFSTVPAFLAMTPEDSREDRLRMVRFGCLLAGLLMLVFASLGQGLFLLLGITLPAVQVGGGIVLFAIGFEMLRAQDLQTRLNDGEKALARRKHDVAITPLAIPLLCGPGAISTIIILQTQAETLMSRSMLLLAVPVVYLGCYLVFKLAVDGARWLNPLALRVLRRIMGLLFVIIATQFCINGIQALLSSPKGS